MAALFASTDNSILITQGSTIGSFCFSEVGFGVGYGYTNIIYSNVQTITEAESALGTLFGVRTESSTITESESALGTFFGTQTESSTITESESALGTFFASTNNIVTTNGAAIAGFSFSEVGFADGYSLLVQDNIQTITDVETALAVLVGVRAESSTITETERALSIFFGVRAESSTITEAESALRAIFASLPESITITEAESAIGLFYGLLAESSTIVDYQFGRGWIKINDTQNPNWAPVDDSQ